MSGRRAVTWVPWALMGVVVVALLAVGTLGGSPPTPAERARNLQEQIRCPSCASQSVAHSDTPSAQAVRLLITQRIAAGDSDEEIRDYVASRYPNGRQLLLDPAGKGFGALVWGVPVAAAVIAVAALALRFRDWRPSTLTVTDADRELVAAAMATDHGAGPSADPAAGPSGTGDAAIGAAETTDAETPL